MLDGKIKILPLIRNTLFALFALYSAQGALYESGSVISQGALVLILAISFYYFFKVIISSGQKELLVKGWTVLLLLNIAGFFFTGDFSNQVHVNMFKFIMACLLPFYPFYYFSKRDILNRKHLIAFFLIILPITILKFYSNQQQIAFEGSGDEEKVVNNISYVFVRLIPFIFLIKKKNIVSQAILLLCMFFIVQGAKRGALICGVVGVLMFFYYQISTTEQKHKGRQYAVIVLELAAMVFFAYYTLTQNEFFLDRLNALSEGDSSGRGDIYGNVFNGWFNNDNLFNLLFGFGFAASQSFTGGILAHNDWFELLSNFGLLGIASYLFLFYCAIKTALNKNWAKDKRLLMVTIILLWFSATLFSMWYTFLDNYSQGILLAYLVGNKDNELA